MRFHWCIRLILLTTVVAVISSCGKTGSGPHATVVTRDGKHLSGLVTENSSAKLTLLGDDKSVIELPADQVKSVTYDAPTPAGDNPGAAAPEIAAARNAEPGRAPQAAPPARTYTLAAGTNIPVRTGETIDSGKATEGQTFDADITRDIEDAAGETVIPRGSNALIVIRSASKGGRFRGKADLQLDLLSVSVAGQKYKVETEEVVKQGRDGVGANKRTAEFAGGGGAAGAIIGAIAGGGKGAAIGGASGAGAGVLTEVLTKGHSIRVPAESVLTFKLERPLRVAAR